jgi:hypothetical protein
MILQGMSATAFRRISLTLACYVRYNIILPSIFFLNKLPSIIYSNQ